MLHRRKLLGSWLFAACLLGACGGEPESGAHGPDAHKSGAALVELGRPPASTGTSAAHSSPAVAAESEAEDPGARGTGEALALPAEAALRIDAAGVADVDPPEPSGAPDPEESTTEATAPAEPARVPADPAFPDELWPAKRRTSAQLTADLQALRDDDVRFNATRAAGRLIQLLDHPLDRERLRPLAEALIDSDDLQQRWMVTELLFRIETNAYTDGERRAALPQLHERALAWLGRPPRLEAFTFRLDPSLRSTLDFCLAQLPYLEPELADLLRSGTERERYRAALVLGCGRSTAHADAVAAVLLPHLADNRTSGDALESAFALKRLGAPVLLGFPSEAADEQQRFFLDALRREIEVPGSTRSDPPRPDLTRAAPHGPVADWKPWRFGWGLLED